MLSRYQEIIREAEAKSEKEIRTSIWLMEEQLHDWVSEVDDDVLNTPFYEYAFGDIEATIEVYYEVLREKAGGKNDKR